MNTLLPTPRDLPADAHNRIREDLVSAVVRDRKSRAHWLPPVIATASAAAVIGVAGVVTALQQDRDMSPAAPGQTTTAPAKIATTTAPIDLVSEQEREAIERSCGEAAAEEPGEYRLRNVYADSGGDYALLYNRAGFAMYCPTGDPNRLGEPPVSISMGRSSQEPDPIVIDTHNVHIKSEQPSRLVGTEFVLGRIAANVARVTFTSDAITVEAVLANGTFMARIPHPGAENPGDVEYGVVRAYDEDGKLLATVD